MSEPAVLFEVENGVATITLNRPKQMNTLSDEIVEGLKNALTRIKEDSAIRAVILTGNGRAFCAGGDIKSFPGNGNNAAVSREYMKFGLPFIVEIAQLEKPVVAAVHGYAVGAGFSIAIASDMIIASEESTFAMSFNKVGLVPDLGGLYHLPRIVGMARAKELALTGRSITPYEAKEYGLVLDVVPQEELLEKAKELATKLAEGATQALGLTKHILNRSYELSLEQVLREEAMAQAIAFSTDDHKEGVKSFFEKRKPIFSGI
ncbi:enoyl-CoA hydratase/isomerase family protein [Alkalihalobacterium chitinilyticum]|uniref:Enoyl-CoA hydratase n=1 Tax=Alkalihalobacterium chitinilyticum TaxID=2980103 RepID=A0ABT5V8N2_9BACI|nr:enoyl-CoA hydratase [Alkalihalobacterium chitinilyticum]MDE5411791.1 enoyl-CoA hydratase [Alkalihalobacterium chitinilyticum]